MRGRRKQLEEANPHRTNPPLFLISLHNTTDSYHCLPTSTVAPLGSSIAHPCPTTSANGVFPIRPANATILLYCVQSCQSTAHMYMTDTWLCNAFNAQTWTGPDLNVSYYPDRAQRPSSVDLASTLLGGIQLLLPYALNQTHYAIDQSRRKQSMHTKNTNSPG